MRYQILKVLLLFSVLGGCAVNPVTGRQDIVLLSENDEIVLGRKTNQAVLKQYRIYTAPALQRYVQAIGTKLAEISHRNNLVYRFTVLDSKEVNAFALPGGYIYITRGLMAYLKSEAELAAVLGHEIGHVTARHSVRQYSANQLTSLGIALGGIFIPGAKQTYSQLSQLFGTALLRGYGREHELEADQLGAEYLARAGYDPQAMFEVIKVLKNQEIFEKEQAQAEGRQANIYHGVFSTHPDGDRRLQEIIGTVVKRNNPATTKRHGHEQYMSLINDVVYGDSVQEGVSRGRLFFHQDLNFAMTFPKDWSVKNRPESIIVIAPLGAAAIQIRAEDINQKQTPQAFMRQRLGLTNLKNGQALKINGLPAYTAISVINTNQGRRQVRVTVIYFEQRAYTIMGLVNGALSQFDQAFLATARSFHALTANEKKLAKPLRLKVVQANEQTRFSDLAKQSPLSDYAESQLRLLNAKYPSGEPQKGELLKIVE